MRVATDSAGVLDPRRLHADGAPRAPVTAEQDVGSFLQRPVDGVIVLGHDERIESSPAGRGLRTDERCLVRRDGELDLLPSRPLKNQPIKRS
jgi:hypothetical protein